MSVSDLDQELSATIQAAWSTNTRAVRNSQWSRFIQFCSDIGESPLPASVETVGRFLVWLGRDCKYSTINNYMSAVISLHKFYAYETDYRASLFLKMILKGLKARVGSETVQMQPFALENIKDMYTNLDKSDEYVMTLWAIVITSFRSLLRKSNLVPTSTQDVCHVLLRKDIEFHDWGIMLNVRSTKTLQCSEYILQIPIYYVKDKIFCAASFICDHIRRFPASPTSVLFVRTMDKRLVPILYRELLDFIKQCAMAVGLDPKKHGCHSLRRSGCAFLHMIKVPLQDIMSMGD